MGPQLTSMLSIAFIMPEISLRPIGGARIIYQYADGLAARGHRVVLVHPQDSLLTSVRHRLDLDPDLVALGCVPHEADSTVMQRTDGPIADPHPWYRSRPDVLNLVVPNLAEEWLGGLYDLTIINNQRTASWARAYSQRMGRRIYFLLDYESHMLGDFGEREEKQHTLHIDWPILASSLVTAHLVESVTGRACPLIPNAIDTDLFHVTIPIDSTKRTLVGFPSGPERTKRTWDAVRALELAKPYISPNTSFWCFGYERIPALPNWITHHVAPSDNRLCELYNQSRIFLVSSEHEGFGLPGAEAMACGAALISTRNGGVETYAVHGDSAILCSVREPGQMASAIVRLMEDENLRRRIAYKGASSITRWTWDKAIAQFEQVPIKEATKM